MIRLMKDKVNYFLELYKQHGSNTPLFSLNGLQTYARVIDIYDGDTITVVISINDYFLKFKCRLHGIDTCEIHSKNMQNKQLAVQARNRLYNLVTNHQIDQTYNKKDIIDYLDKNVSVVWVKCLDFDKYGRLLIDCYSSEDKPKSFSEILIDEKLAYPYDGETKLTEEQQVVYLTRS